MNKKILYIILAIISVIILYVVFHKPETPEEKIVRIERTRKEAYEFAVSCGRVDHPKLRFQDITWIVVPGNKMRINATDGSIDLAGFFNPADSTIWTPETKQDVFWILAHESMHAIGYVYPITVGDRGHPDFPFKDCNLKAEQH